MKKFLLLLATVFSIQLRAQSLYFPPATGNAWDTLSPASLGWCQGRIDSMLDWIGAQSTKAFIVLKDGRIAIEKYYGSFTRDSFWYWASAGKTLTTFTVGIARQEGFLALSDTSSKYLGQGWTNCPSTEENKITVWNQLTMTSGLDEGVTDPYCTEDTCLVCIADAGTRWAYHNAPYTLLDGVIENATGQTLNAYFAAKVKNSTGMNGTFIRVDYNNVYFSNARSMARFGLLMLNGGNWNGTQIMTDTAYYNAMIHTSQNLNRSYGYLWWLNGKQSFMLPGLQTVFPGYLMPDAPADAYSALGKNGQIISVSPSSNMVFVRMGDNVTGPVTVTLPNDIWKMIGALECPPNAVAGTEMPPLRLFPNPATGKLTISGIPTVKPFTVELFNLQGILCGKFFNRDVLDVSSLPAGCYRVRIFSEGKLFSRQFIRE